MLDGFDVPVGEEKLSNYIGMCFEYFTWWPLADYLVVLNDIDWRRDANLICPFKGQFMNGVEMKKPPEGGL